MLNGDCFGFVLELFETGDSFATDGVGFADVEPLVLVVVLCVVGLAGGTVGALLATLLDAPLDTATLAPLVGKLSTGDFSRAILIGDESTLAGSFVCKYGKWKSRLVFSENRYSNSRIGILF